MRRLFSLATAVLIVTVASAHAQSQALDSTVNGYVKSEMQNQHIPGLSLLVARTPGQIWQA